MNCHMHHCFQGEYEGGCKYGEVETCPARPAAKPEPCKEKDNDYACKNRHQCWEPCGELGHSMEHARPAPKETQDAVNAALGLNANPQQAHEPEVVAWMDPVSGLSWIVERTTVTPGAQLITLQSHREAMKQLAQGIQDDWELDVRQHREAIAKKDAALLAAPVHVEPLTDEVRLLCEWIAETPHQRGSINGKAAQILHSIGKDQA